MTDTQAKKYISRRSCLVTFSRPESATVFKGTRKMGKTIVLDRSALNINKTRPRILSLSTLNLTDPQLAAHSVLFYYFLSLIMHQNYTTFHSGFWGYAVTGNNKVTLSQVNLIPKSVEQSSDLRLSVPVCEMQHFLCLCAASSPSSDFGTSLWVLMHTVWTLLNSRWMEEKDVKGTNVLFIVLEYEAGITWTESESESMSLFLSEGFRE